ncbi:hypothetical protein [Marinagarivorans algicola]|uniref:hypothetical protein n=1 Tax=Marinagarivorans algicola TaxID=1513270 RepID=UPI0006B63F15|nr:hypothetical protein [Marinagarivorans algicola]
MKVFFFVAEPQDDSATQDTQKIAEQLQAWVGEDNPHAVFIHTEACEQGGARLGVEMKIKLPKQLNTPLEAFYKIANEYQCDFVVGFIDGDDYEEVCFFGKEEGKPDPFAIGCYLGFE